VLRRVDHVEAQMEKAVSNGFVDLERKLLGRVGDALVERITGKLEGALSPLSMRFEGLEGAVGALAKTQVDLAHMQESLAKELARVASQFSELATDTAATKEATGRHVARLADIAVELGGLKDLSSSLEARVVERFSAVDASVASIGKGVERVVALETAVASVGKGVERVAALETAVARLGTDILRLASVESAVAAVAKELQPVAALGGKLDAIAADLDSLRSAHVEGLGSFAARQELVEGAVSGLTHELRAASEAAEQFHGAVAGRAGTTDERLGKLDGALLALVSEQQRLAEVLKGATDAARTSVAEQRSGIARVEEAVGKGSSTVEALVRAASETVSAQIEKANRMQDAASKGTVQRLVDLSTAVRDLDGRVGNELSGVVRTSTELSKIVGSIEAKVSQNFSLAVNQIGKLVEGQTATLQRGTMGLIADVGLAKNVLDELTARLERISDSVHGIKGLGDDVRRVGTSVDGGSSKQQALLQETFDQTRTRLDVMGERVARITEVMNELSSEMKKPKGWFRG
jgi:peptidoglycan hydrolase CwlO-like protein